MRNPIFEKPGILSENLKTLTSSNYPTVQYFFAKTSHTFPTYYSLQKGVWDFFCFVYILSYLQKLKNPGFYKPLLITVFKLLLITQDPNKIKKIPHTLL